MNQMNVSNWVNITFLLKYNVNCVKRQEVVMNLLLHSVIILLYSINLLLHNVLWHNYLSVKLNSVCNECEK